MSETLINKHPLIAAAPQETDPRACSDWLRHGVSQRCALGVAAVAVLLALALDSGLKLWPAQGLSAQMAHAARLAPMTPIDAFAYLDKP
ncbi:hypothetical protein [Magnetofaba australis]|uniref:hypothetical protein n=1 Tax=Magnetofaba australis TaxID=1472297 RepID=UPI000A19F066|nr:hypothetical protein [Magnetofaba australis]